MHTAPHNCHLTPTLKELDENKYNKMTTIDMLKHRKNDYQVVHDKLIGQLDDMSERYYKNVEIPPEVVKKITDMNKEVLKIEKNIDDIDTALNVIECEL